jgi:hypothetical protein
VCVIELIQDPIGCTLRTKILGGFQKLTQSNMSKVNRVQTVCRQWWSLKKFRTSSLKKKMQLTSM